MNRIFIIHFASAFPTIGLRLSSRTQGAQSYNITNDIEYKLRIIDNNIRF